MYCSSTRLPYIILVLHCTVHCFYCPLVLHALYHCANHNRYTAGAETVLGPPAGIHEGYVESTRRADHHFRSGGVVKRLWCGEMAVFAESLSISLCLCLCLCLCLSPPHPPPPHTLAVSAVCIYVCLSICAVHAGLIGNIIRLVTLGDTLISRISLSIFSICLW